MMLAHIEFFYQNQFINEYARKTKAKIPESRNFLVRYRRTYVPNKLQKLKEKKSEERESVKKVRAMGKGI